MVLACQRAFGFRWYHAPGYWPTEDSVVPYRLVAPTFAALESFHAGDALMTMRGINLAFAGEEHRGTLESAIDEAYPAVR